MLWPSFLCPHNLGEKGAKKDPSYERTQLDRNPMDSGSTQYGFHGTIPELHFRFQKTDKISIFIEDLSRIQSFLEPK